MPSLTEKDAAFTAWMADNAPGLKAYAHAYADKFRIRLENGITTYRQMEMVAETGVPMDTARNMVSALLRIYVTGSVR